MTPPTSPCVQSLYFLAQASLLTTCSSFRNALFLALNFLMLTHAKACLMVLTEACGATSLCNSNKGRRHAFLDSLTRRRGGLILIILCHPGMGRFFTSPLFWNRLYKLRIVLLGRLKIFPISEKRTRFFFQDNNLPFLKLSEIASLFSRHGG